MMAAAESHPQVTMDDVRSRLARVMQLLDQLVAEPHTASATVAAERSSSSNGGDMA